MITFDPNHDPSALVVPVQVAGVVRSRPRMKLLGLIDTGADLTAIPAIVKDRYALPEMGRIQLEGIEGTTSTVFTYEVYVAVQDQPRHRLEVVVTPFPFLILGRDWLRFHHLLIDGPSQQFQVSQTPFAYFDSA